MQVEEIFYLGEKMKEKPTNFYSKIYGNKPRYNEYFVLSLAVSKNDMMIQMVDKSNTTPIGQDRETLTFKSLLYLNVAVHVQVFRLFCHS